MIRHWSSGLAFINNNDSTKSIIWPTILTPIQKASFPNGLLSFFDAFLTLLELITLLLLSLATKGEGF